MCLQMHGHCQALMLHSFSFFLDLPHCDGHMMDAKFLKYCMDSGIVSQDVLRRSLAMTDDGTSIYAVLIHQAGVSQEQLAITAGEFYECPVVDLSKVTPEPAATGYGSGALCRRLNFIPFSVDPVVGVLVALVDYTQADEITGYLREAKVERMKFYIAPMDTLLQVVNKVYASDRDVLNDMPGNLRRRASILRTQYLNLDMVNNGAGRPDLESSHALQEVQKELRSCKEENAQLRHRIEQLSETLELEITMSRKLAQILKSKGVLDNDSFERWLMSQR